MSYFPSLEEIDGGQTEAHPIEAATSPAGAGAVVDLGVPETEEDFLTREKAVLGEADAAAIVDGNSQNVNGSSKATNGSSAEHDLLGADEPITMTTTSPVAPVAATAPIFSAPVSQTIVREESEAVKEWKERRALAIQRRDEQSESRKTQTRDAAKAAINDFYDNYNNKKDAAIAKTRQEEKEFVEAQESTVAGGTTWERIGKLVDLTESHARSAKYDKSRFRELLVSLKSDQNAPGAKGY
ncbi:clathrin light chain [Lipomyces oligophaga]|uniref:clathrin light chain n=1 Tax=Lipomyces oligophaga TaxID=45792 RepID=UPI0034CE59DC